MVRTVTERLAAFRTFLGEGSGSSNWVDSWGSEAFEEVGSVTGTETFLDLARIRCLGFRVTSTRVMTESLCKGMLERNCVWMRLRFAGAIAS